ncbi:MAG: MFS transporter [Xanthobacteraceae bacterium]|jgi:PAT family beta-lactamase induction signal transducer AmpG
MTATPDVPPRTSLADTLAVYLQRRVLVVLMLGFSSGLPIVLVGSTLQAWMKQSGIDIKTIGLFAAVAVPYNVKFLWAPLVDALDVPVLGRLLGRRRAWLLLSQAWLMAAIACLGLCDPAISAFLVAIGALVVATASATQDIVVDAFRVESLPENEQAAGMASYVAAYRVGALISGAGALFLVAAFESEFGGRGAWTACYAVMAVLVLIGVLGTLLAREPASSAAAEADHALPAHKNSLKRAFSSALDAFRDFLARHLAIAALAFVALFKLADALAFALLTPFVLDLGFSLTQLATIRNGVGFVVAVLGGFAGGLVARALPLSISLWIGGILQTIMILAFSWQAVVGKSLTWLTFTTTIEFFTDAVGTVIFVAYLSALCRNPLYTATQFALLTALAALGRNVFALPTGYIAHAVGWAWFFVICALAGLPALILLAWLQTRRHFDGLVLGKK